MTKALGSLIFIKSEYDVDNNETLGESVMDWDGLVVREEIAETDEEKAESAPQSAAK